MSNKFYQNCFFNRFFLAIVNVDSNKLVIGNYGNTGYYRVNYDLSTWQKITQHLMKNHKVNIFLFIKLIIWQVLSVLYGTPN